MTHKVQVAIKAPVAVVPLNKPDRLNALDFEMWEDIRRAAEALDASADVRVAILTGAGGAFCAGLDLKAGSTLSLPPDLSPAALDGGDHGDPAGLEAREAGLEVGHVLPDVRHRLGRREVRGQAERAAGLEVGAGAERPAGP